MRGRPTKNSKPILYTKDHYIFSIDKKYLSNLNSGVLTNDLLFSVPLGQRARYSSDLLDKELGTVFNWQKMFKDAGSVIQIKSGPTKIKVLISGRDWVLTDSTGLGVSIQRNRNELDIFLPSLLDAFNVNKITLSPDIEFSVTKAGMQWLIKDNKALQTYEIRNAKEQLNIYQLSKYPIKTRLLKLDLSHKTELSEGTLPDALLEGFEKQNIPMKKSAKLTTNDDNESWQITYDSQIYNIQTEEGWLQVYLGLDSKWILIKVSSNLIGWVPSEDGNVVTPPPPILSSRQQFKQKITKFFEN